MKSKSSDNFATNGPYWWKKKLKRWKYTLWNGLLKILPQFPLVADSTSSVSMDNESDDFRKLLPPSPFSFKGEGVEGGDRRIANA